MKIATVAFVATAAATTVSVISVATVFVPNALQQLRDFELAQIQGQVDEGRIIGRVVVDQFGVGSNLGSYANAHGLSRCKADPKIPKNGAVLFCIGYNQQPPQERLLAPKNSLTRAGEMVRRWRATAKLKPA